MGHHWPEQCLWVRVSIPGLTDEMDDDVYTAKSYGATTRDRTRTPKGAPLAILDGQTNDRQYRGAPVRTASTLPLELRNVSNENLQLDMCCSRFQSRKGCCAKNSECPEGKLHRMD